MNPYELISFDMDGTLLTSAKTVSRRTKATIDRAVEQGKSVILATGRTPAELREYRDTFRNIQYYVCENGALVYDSFSETVLASECIPAQIVDQIMQLAAQQDVLIYIASDGRTRMNRQDAQNAQHFSVDQYQTLFLETAILHDDIAADYREQRFPVEKFNLYSASTEIRDWLMEQLRELPLTIVYAEETGLEISPLHMSKAVGFRRLCALLGVAPERAIAVGDADNDMEIMRAAGLAVAMGNARPHVKQLCDVVVADNDHDGCVEAMEKYLLCG